MPTRTSRGRLALLALGLVVVIASACTIRRDYLGSPVRMDGVQTLVAGRTTKGEVLAQLGPPDGIVRQFDGDIFVYRFVRRNTATFRLEEPVFTNLELFSWTRSEQRHDSIVVLFDDQGVVQQVGAAEGTEAMQPF